MEQIDMTKYLPCTARLVGGTLYILDGEGRVQRRLDPRRMVHSGDGRHA